MKDYIREVKNYIEEIKNYNKEIKTFLCETDSLAQILHIEVKNLHKFTKK